MWIQFCSGMGIKDIIIEVGAVVSVALTTLIGILILLGTAAKKLDTALKSIKKLMPPPKKQSGTADSPATIKRGGSGIFKGSRYISLALLVIGSGSSFIGLWHAAHRPNPLSNADTVWVSVMACGVWFPLGMLVANALLRQILSLYEMLDGILGLVDRLVTAYDRDLDSRVPPKQ